MVMGPFCTFGSPYNVFASLMRYCQTQSAFADDIVQRFEKYVLVLQFYHMVFY